MNSPPDSKAALKDYATTVAILEALERPILIFDSQHIIRYANTKALDLVGSEAIDSQVEQYFEFAPSSGTQQESSWLERLDLTASGALSDLSGVLQTPYGRMQVVCHVKRLLPANNQPEYYLLSLESILPIQPDQAEITDSHLPASEPQRSQFNPFINLLHHFSQTLTRLQIQADQLKSFLSQANLKDEQLRHAADSLCNGIAKLAAQTGAVLRKQNLLSGRYLTRLVLKDLVDDVSYDYDIWLMSHKLKVRNEIQAEIGLYTSYADAFQLIGEILIWVVQLADPDQSEELIFRAQREGESIIDLVVLFKAARSRNKLPAAFKRQLQSRVEKLGGQIRRLRMGPKGLIVVIKLPDLANEERTLLRCLAELQHSSSS